MVHTAWTGRDGAPQGITGLAQTPDGTLWIGSVGGLYSFNGVTYTAFETKPDATALSAKTIESLFVSRTGELWVFGYRGAPSRIHDGVVTSFDRSDGEAISTLEFPQEDSAGTIWAVVNGRQLVRLGMDSIWHKVASPAEEQGEISALVIDRSDTLWLIQNDLLYMRSSGATHFSATRVTSHGPAQISESLDHSLWVLGILNHFPNRSMRASALQHVDHAGNLLPSVRPSHGVNSFLIAPDGSMWLSEDGRTIERIVLGSLSSVSAGRPSSPLDIYAMNNGTTITARILFRDADGNIWIGGLEGLDRFTRSTLVPALPEARAGVWFSCVDGHDDVWLGNPTTPLRKITGGRVEVIPGMEGVTDLHCGAAEKVWFSGQDRISTVVGGRAHPLPNFPSENGYAGPRYVLGFAAVNAHTLIALVRGLSRITPWVYDGSAWRQFQPEGLDGEITGLSRGDHGNLYFGHPGGSIDMFGGEPLRLLQRFTSDLGTVTGFTRTGHGLLAYGSDGIGFVGDGVIHQLHLLHPEHSIAINGAAEAANGELWINGRRGIVRIPTSEAQAALANVSHRVSSVEVHEANFTGPSLPSYNGSTVNRDLKGTLWISTLHGVVHVDPAHLMAPAHPPQLTIHTITGDNRLLGLGRVFSPDTHTITVQYFGIDLTSPGRVTYKYNLEGYDDTWQDVGQSTTATYTRLRPGRYVFHVIASNGAAWNSPPASEAFTVLPHFYQTTHFAVLCGLGILVLIWISFTLRIRFVGNAITMRAEERADERIRIARDLHDTLLQSVQGLQLSFHVAAQAVPPDAPYREGLDRVLALADRLILEGRTRVAQLRSEPSTNEDLVSGLEQTIADLNHTALGVQCRLLCSGSSQQLRPHVSSEIYLIARESLTNAFRHAAASEIILELGYTDQQFVMSCHDNGKGFAPPSAGESGRTGQWGLRGISERAQRIGGRLTIKSMPGLGTQIVLTIPSYRVYVAASRFAITLAKVLGKHDNEPGPS